MLTEISANPKMPGSWSVEILLASFKHVECDLREEFRPAVESMLDQYGPAPEEKDAVNKGAFLDWRGHFQVGFVSVNQDCIAPSIQRLTASVQILYHSL